MPKALDSRRSGRLQTVFRLATGRFSQKTNRAGWCLFGLLCVVSLGQLLIGVDPQDEGQLLTYPWLITRGWVPYRDIWMSYPPGTFVLLAGLFKVGLPGLFAERGLSFVARGAYLLIINRTLTGSWRRFSWLGTPISFSLLFFSSGARAYPWVVGLPFLFMALLSLREKPVTAGLLFFLAGTFRFEFALAGFVALAAITVLDASNTVTRRRLLGITALLTPTAAFYLMLNLLTGGSAVKDIFLDPILLIDPVHRLPLFPPQPWFLSVPLEVIVLGASPFIAAVAIVWKRPYVAATNLGIVALFPQFFQRADWQHLFALGSITVPWAMVSLVMLYAKELEADLETEQHGSGSWSRHRVLSSGLAIVGASAGAWPAAVLLYGALVSPLSPLNSESLVRNWSKHNVPMGFHTIIADSRIEAADDLQVSRYLKIHGSFGQRLFIAPSRLRLAIYNQTALYFVLGMTPATRYLEMLPGLEKTASVQEQIIHQLKGCTWVVLWKGGYSWEPNSSVVPGSPLLQQFIKSNYRLVLENATYRVLRAHTASETAA